MKRYLIVIACVMVLVIVLALGTIDRFSQNVSYGTCTIVDKTNLGSEYEVTVMVESYSWDDGFRANILKLISPNKQYRAKISKWRGEQLRAGDTIFIRFERGDLTLIPYEFKIQ